MTLKQILIYLIIRRYKNVDEILNYTKILGIDNEIELQHLFGSGMLYLFNNGNVEPEDQLKEKFWKSVPKFVKPIWRLLKIVLSNYDASTHR